MNPDQKLIAKFEAELKHRVALKTNPSSVPEKALLESFKYFDLEKRGDVDFKTFSMVVKMRLGIILFSDEELTVIFNHFTERAGRLVYREFISNVYETQINLSLRDSRLSEARSFIGGPGEGIGDEETVRRLIEFVIYKMRTLEFSSFFKLYRELQVGRSAEREVSQGQLVVALKKTGVEISAEEVQRVFSYLSGGRPLLSLDRLFDCLLINFNEARKAIVRNAFDRLDYTSSGKVSLQLLRELYNPRNSVAVREGRQTADELGQHFGLLVDEFTRLNSNQFIVNANQFLFFFSFISGAIKDEKEFAQFVDNCFRFNELPRSSGSVKGERPFKPDQRLLEELSVRTSTVEDFCTALSTQLAARGNRSFIAFFKLLKCNDFDSDGFVFEKEFDRAITELRLSFSKTQTQKLFEKMAEQRMRLNYTLLLKNLVPEFDVERAELIQQVYEKLASARPVEPLAYDKLVNAFNARNHPDFKNGLRADYEVKTEFVDSLKEFLSLQQGSNQVILWPSLLRFFEFFAATWSTAYLRSVVESVFKVRTGASVYSLEQNTPYGLTDPIGPIKTKPGLPTQLKFLNEYNKVTGKTVAESAPIDNNAFKKKGEAQPVNYPYHTENEKAEEVSPSTRHQNYKTKTPFYVDEPRTNPGQGTRNVAAEELHEMARAPDSRTSRYSRKEPSRGSEFNPMAREHLVSGQKDLPNSPEEGSVVSDARSHKVINDLNKKIQSAISMKSSVHPQTAAKLFQRLVDNIRQTCKIHLVLSIEYEMTAQSDKKGSVDFEVFSTVLENYDLLKGFKQDEIHALFVSQLTDTDKVHIQTLANKIRGQMSQLREKQTIDLFDRICPPNEDAMLVPEIKAAFLPHKCKLKGYSGMADIREMLNTVLELFVSLNVTIKNQDFIDLDDFLYMMDNFSFFFVTEDEYARFITESFK